MVPGTRQNVRSTLSLIFGPGRLSRSQGRGGGGGAPPTTGLRERGNDTSRSAAADKTAATRRIVRGEERVSVQGPVKKQQPDGMSHTGACLSETGSFLAHRLLCILWCWSCGMEASRGQPVHWVPQGNGSVFGGQTARVRAELQNGREPFGTIPGGGPGGGVGPRDQQTTPASNSFIAAETESPPAEMWPLATAHTQNADQRRGIVGHKGRILGVGCAQGPPRTW